MFTVKLSNSVFKSSDLSGDNYNIFFDGYADMDVEVCNNVIIGGFEGIVLFDNIYGRVLNNIISGCAYAGIDILTSTTPEQLIVDCNDVDSTIPTPIESDPSFIGANNIYDDPLFTEPETNDFSLQAGSPCRDAGIGSSVQSTVPLVDFNGVTRRIDITAMGIFEYLPIPTPTLVIPAIPITVDAVSIPLFENGNFSETVSLDGNNYGISLSWNARCGAWFLSIADGNGNMLRTGIRLNVAYPVKLQYNDVGLPAGDFLLLDQKEETGLQEAGRHDFTSGRKLELWYLNETD